MSTDETRCYLNGIYLHKGSSGDGHVFGPLQQMDIASRGQIFPLPDGAETMPSLIVPRKAVSELYKLLDDSENDVEISLSTRSYSFRFG